MNEIFNNLKIDLSSKVHSKLQIEQKVFEVRDKIKTQLEKEGRLVNQQVQKTYEINDLKKYDVIYMPTFGTFHYILVYKVNILDNKLYGFSFSSKENFSIAKITRDRVFQNSYNHKRIIRI